MVSDFSFWNAHSSLFFPVLTASPLPALFPPLSDFPFSSFFFLLREESSFPFIFFFFEPLPTRIPSPFLCVADLYEIPFINAASPLPA